MFLYKGKHLLSRNFVRPYAASLPLKIRGSECLKNRVHSREMQRQVGVWSTKGKTQEP